jgi:hypothetical protein
MRKCWCARCGRAYALDGDLAGRRIRCGACGYVQEIPEPLDGPAPDADSSTDSILSGPVGAPAEGRPTTRRPWAGLDSRRLRAFTREESRLQGLSVCLLILSAADLLMTFALFRSSPTFYESNPLARWVFLRWDMAGMVFFKFSLIAFAIALGEVIERRRPRWGKAVLVVGCIAACYAFTHGLRLYLGFGGQLAGESD